jgi:hypothetical protein
MNFEEYLSEGRVLKAVAAHYGVSQAHFHTKKVKEGTDAAKGHTGHLAAWHDAEDDEWHVNHVTLDASHKLVKHDPTPRETFDSKKAAIDHVNSQS